jgi:hypothetical protein
MMTSVIARSSTTERSAHDLRDHRSRHHRAGTGRPSGDSIAPNPRHPAGRQILFYAGDDAEAKASFHELVDGFGFAPVDIGSLREGGRLMQVDGRPLSALHALRQD